MKLIAEAIIKFTLGVVLTGVLLFLPAGTLLYFRGVVFMILLFVPMFVAGLVMMIKNPESLKRRLDGNEKESEQKAVVASTGAIFVLGFVSAGISFRFDFLMLPMWATYVGAAIFVPSYIIYAIIMKQNKYLFRTVKVVEGQQVIDSGFYGRVRHPMYGTTVFLFLSASIVLGSVISVVVFMCYPFIIAKRIKNEEELLEKALPGYTEYKQKVKYKMIPFVW